MIKYLQIGAFFLIGFIIQPSLLNLISIGGYTPNLLLGLVILFSFLFEEEVYGVVYGALFGILNDFMYGSYIGPTPIARVLVAIIILVIREHANIENIVNLWLVSLGGIVLYYIFNWGLNSFAGNPVGIQVVLSHVPVILIYTLVFITAMYLFLRKRVIRHHRDRYIK